MLTRIGATAAVAVGLALAGACGGGASHSTVTVTSPSFAAGAALPRRVTCDGAGVTPALQWSMPATSATPAPQAVVLTDPDAPGGTFVHWIVFGLDGRTRQLREGQPPPGGMLGPNSRGTLGYTPPCPPRGQEHRYVFTVYELDKAVSAVGDRRPVDIVALLNRAASARGSLIARYRR
jgi:Raf kinase inhibitor-like YbhB/YbcL family protein